MTPLARAVNHVIQGNSQWGSSFISLNMIFVLILKITTFAVIITKFTKMGGKSQVDLLKKHNQQ